MIVSFRARLIAVATLVTAAVLAAVLTIVWSNVREIELQRLDARLCLEARRLATSPLRPGEDPRLDADVAAKLRLPDASHLLLAIERDGALAYRSQDWPASVPVAFGNDATARGATSDAARGGPRRERPPAEPGNDGPRPPDTRVPVDPPAPASCEKVVFDGAGTAWRAAVASRPGGRGFVGAEVSAATEELSGALKGTLPIVVPLSLAAVGLGAWLLSAVSLRPVQRLRRAMRSVGRNDLSRRLPSQGEDREFRELIAEYNAMLERLETSFEQASRFSADAAHELRTPLTILQGRLEQAIAQSENRAIQDDLSEMQDEIGRLASITRKLLLLSQADAGKLPLHRSRVDLTELLDALVADAEMLAGGNEVRTSVERGLVVEADEQLLRQLLNNLVSNAIRYCRPGGWIDVAARRHDASVEVAIANATEAIVAGSRERLFDRFHRLDPARGRQSEGTGLGLSLAREIARAHGGDVVLDEGPADEFRLRLVLPSA